MAISDELMEGVLPMGEALGDIQVFFDDGSTLIRASGEIDLALGPELEDAGRDAIDREEPVRLDVSQVTFIDSVGTGFIARLASAGQTIGCPLVVSGASRRVRETIALSGLTPIVHLVDEADEGDAPA